VSAGPDGAAERAAHTVRRRLRELLPGGLGDDAQAPLEAQQLGAPEAPRLAAAQPIEGHAVRAVRVAAGDGQAAALVAFLDGTQKSVVVHYADGLPVVHGTVAAVVRARRGRTMTTWARPIVEQRLYAPCAHLAPGVRDAVSGAGLPVVDTTEPGPDGAPPPSHPIALLDRAVHFVQADRERAEREPRRGWCARQSVEGGFRAVVDGGIQGSERSPRRAACSAWSRATARCTPRATRCAWCSASARGERSTAFRVSVGGARRWRAGTCACATRPAATRCGASCGSRPRSPAPPSRPRC
jgi:hypothetical protein